MSTLQVTNIQFNLDPGDDSIPMHIQDQVQQDLQQLYINTNWTVLSEEDLINEIESETLFSVESINYITL